MCKFGIIFLFCSLCCLALTKGVSKSGLKDFEGNFIIANTQDATVYILPKDKTSWTKENALWTYQLKKGKDGLKQSFGSKVNDAKYVVNSKGQVCLLIVGHGPGLALYNMETGHFDFSGSCGKMATHSADLLPDGNFTVADPDDNGKSRILIISGKDDGQTKILDSRDFSGIHGVVWDDHRKLLWAWGGNLASFSYKDGKLGQETKISGKPSWAHGGHDLVAKDKDTLLFSATGGGIGTYDISTKQWTQVSNTTKAKGIDYDPESEEYALCKHDSPSLSSRTYQIRNPDKVKWVFSPHSEMSMYKARFFHESAMNPRLSSQAPSPTPAELVI